MLTVLEGNEQTNGRYSGRKERTLVMLRKVAIDPQTFGGKLRIFRKRYDLQRKEFARLVGCSVRSIDRWERNLSSPMGIYKSRIKAVLLDLSMNKK